MEVEITNLEIIDLPQLIDDYGQGHIKSKCGKIYWEIDGDKK